MGRNVAMHSISRDILCYAMPCFPAPVDWAYFLRWELIQPDVLFPCDKFYHLRFLDELARDGDRPRPHRRRFGGPEGAICVDARGDMSESRRFEQTHPDYMTGGPDAALSTHVKNAETAIRANRRPGRIQSLTAFVQRDGS